MYWYLAAVDFFHKLITDSAISKFYYFIKRSSQVIHFLSTGQGSMDENLIP